MTCLLFISTVMASAGVADPTASLGTLNLSHHDLYRDGKVRLDGDWQFYLDSTLLPEAFAKGGVPALAGYYAVPKYWTSYRGLNLPSQGDASYRLLIHVKEEKRLLSLLTPEIFTEYRLFVNGELIDSHGKFADGKIRFLSPRVFTFENSSDTIEILLNISNHSHGNAGIGQSFFLGAPEEIQKQHLFSITIEMTLVAVCLFAGIYHMILFALRTEERDLLYFGFFCILLALRTIFTGTTFIMQIVPDLSFEPGSRIATAVIPLCVMAFQAYSFHFFLPHFQERPHKSLMLVHCIYLTMTLAMPTMLYSELFTQYLAIIFLSALLIIGVNIYCVVIRARYSAIFISGFLFLFTGVTNDMLHYMQVINTGYFLSIWFSFFIIAQSVMLAIKFANEHRTIEALSKKLQLTDKIKDEFLANTSHELRTPLNGIIGISDSLIDGIAGKLPGKAIENLKLISSSARRLSSLINDILDHSKLRNNDITLSMRDIDLRQITEVVLTVVKATTPSSRLELINEISCQFPAVRGDENRLQQILFNLIGNAVKFTAEGQVKVSAQDRGSYVTVTVQDTGPGIQEDRQDDIFSPYEQIDGTATRLHGGTGLGLSITRELVEIQGGRITVQSDGKSGSLFSFTLKKGSGAGKPVTQKRTDLMREISARKSELESPIPAFEPVAPEQPGEHILIVDDDTTNIRVLENYLFLEEYRFASATNGIKALELLEARKFDLVLLDIMMPLMSGYEVLNRIRKRYTAYELPVLMLTAGKQKRDIVTAFQSGANDYLTKPIDREELIARIKTLLSLSKAVSTAIENAALANTDALTGLYNRRFMINSGSREFTTALRLNRSLSLIILDIDRFKQVNDNYGHAEGDRVLKHLSGVIISNIRGVDVAIRYGGEEFIIILPGTTSEGAVQTAEKIRHLVEKSTVPTINSQTIRYTVSIGVASFHDPESSFEELINVADKMLYQSKNEGRNRITVFSP